MSKYTALINEFDKDYRSYSGEVLVKVNSWEEAEEWCRKESWSGYGYTVHLLKDNTTSEVYWSKEESDMNKNKGYLLLRVSYDKDTMIDDETLQECYDGDITKWLKMFLKEDGKFSFIDCFDIEDIVEEKE